MDLLGMAMESEAQKVKHSC